jgi:hypothetical protein
VNYGPVGFSRSGFVIGFALGGGAMSAEDCPDCEDLNGGAGEIHLGGMLSPSAALLYDGSMVSYEPEGGSLVLVHGIHTIAAQWFFDRVWVKAGLGFGKLTLQEKNNSGSTPLAESESGLAFLFAGGVELYQGETFALDLQVRVATVGYDAKNTDDKATERITNTSFLLGFNWY